MKPTGGSDRVVKWLLTHGLCKKSFTCSLINFSSSLRPLHVLGRKNILPFCFSPLAESGLFFTSNILHPPHPIHSGFAS